MPRACPTRPATTATMGPLRRRPVLRAATAPMRPKAPMAAEVANAGRGPYPFGAGGAKVSKSNRTNSSPASSTPQGQAARHGAPASVRTASKDFIAELYSAPLLQAAADRGDALRVESEPVHPSDVAGMFDLQAAIHDDRETAGFR